MLEIIREFGRDGAVLLLGLAVGAAWITAIVAPNTSYDNLSANQAEKQKFLPGSSLGFTTGDGSGDVEVTTVNGNVSVGYR